MVAIEIQKTEAGVAIVYHSQGDAASPLAQYQYDHIARSLGKSRLHAERENNRICIVGLRKAAVELRGDGGWNIQSSDADALQKLQKALLWEGTVLFSGGQGRHSWTRLEIPSTVIAGENWQPQGPAPEAGTTAVPARSDLGAMMELAAAQSQIMPRVNR